MKISTKFILSILGSALIVGTGSAQTWTVNGTTQATQLTTSAGEAAVAIDPLTGIASIKTAGAGPSISISANPATVAVSVATSVSWTASGFGNNLTCTRTSNASLAGWSGTSIVTSGSASVTMPASAQTVTITLSCTGDNGSASNFTSVVVTQPGTGQCASRPPGVFGSPRQVVNQTFFSAWARDFPGQFNTAYGAGVAGISDGTVIAYSFVAPTGNSIEGYLLAVYSPDGGGRAGLAAGFSECAGEISNMTPTCSGSLGKIRSEWTTNGRVGACNLIPGRTYYYNLSTDGPCVFGPDPGTPGGVCAFRLESKRYFP